MTAEEEPAQGLLRRVLAHRDLRLFLAFMALSQAGQLAYVVALSVFMFERTGSAAWVSAVVIARVLPVAAFSAVAGTVADRWECRRLLLVSNQLNAAVLLAVAGVMLLQAPVWFVLPLVVTSAVVSTPLTPTAIAYMPALVPEDDLVPANTAREGARKLSQLVGPAGASVLIAAGSTVTAVAGGLMAVLLSSVCLMAVSTKSRGSVTLDRGTPRRRERSRMLAEGIRALRDRPGTLTVIALFGAYYLLLGFEHVVYTVMADQVLGFGAEGLGHLFAAIGVGGVAVAATASRLAGGGNAGAALGWSAIAVGACFSLLGWVRHPVIALLLLAVIGAGGIIFHVVAVTTLQRVLVRGVLGRVAGLRTTVTYAAMLVGSLSAPMLVAWAGLRITFLVCGLLLIGSAAVALPRLVTLSTAAERRRLELRPLVEMLERVRLFEGATRPTLEAMAKELVREPVAAGQDVVRQGETAEHLYIADSGSFAVLVDAGDVWGPQPVATLGPGDYFGEIGVLRGIPRIATVRAETDGLVYRLPAERLLAVLMDGLALSPSAVASVDDRINESAPHLGGWQSDDAYAAGMAPGRRSAWRRR